MITVAVIDDEPLARRGVITRLSAHPDLRLHGEYEHAASAHAGLLARPPELAFIDIQMPGQSGLELLASLPIAQRPLVILLTAHEGFAVRAFALNVLDYLLKPIDDARFAEALERARHQLAMRGNSQIAAAPRPVRTERFSVRIGHREIFVPVSEIVWIQADGDYATLYLADRNLPLRESLQRLEELLDPACFVRVHRSAIVRIDHVAELQPLPNRDALIRLHNGTPVRVSRTYIDELLQRLRLASTG